MYTNSTFKLITFVLGFITSSYSQDFSSLWQDHFSYNKIVDVVSGENKLYAAAENAVFIYDFSTLETNTITTIEGLSGQQISTVYFSDVYETLLIGYETGLIEIYSELDNSVLSVVDILEKQNIPPDDKQVNHFYEHNGLVYISTDFGISVYDLERLEFGDSYFLGTGGAQISVMQTTILNDEIFAACLDNNGIKKADINNPNLIDAQEWQTLITGNYHTINSINNKVYSVRSNRVLYEIDNTTINTLFTFSELPLDAEIGNANLIFSTTSAVYIYDENIQLVNSFQATTDFNTTFTSAAQGSDFVYLGTIDLGVLRVNISDTTSDYFQILPNGPLENNVFRVDATTQTVWVTYGAYPSFLNPYFPQIDRKGVNYFFNNIWETIPYEDLLETPELTRITPNVFNPNQVFIGSFFRGILEINDFEATIQYTENNSGLEYLRIPSDPSYIDDIRISTSKFDTNGLLWSITSLVDNALKSYDPATGLWQAYSFSNLINDPFDNLGFMDLEIGNDGTKWVGSYDFGLIGYNENNGTDNRIKNINSEDQNVPRFARFTALAMDNRNQLWIGTTFGLRVLFNTAGFFDDPNPQLSEIIILEDGIPKELLENQSITDIEVDGSNNKWVGTGDSGAFYFSQDGQSTIYHFTTDNSPLSSNTINDISLDQENGIVYIATNRGLLSFTAGGSGPKESLENAYVYPNPVRPEYDILGFNNLNDINKGIKVSGLTENVNIKITDIEGNLVAEAQSNVNLRSSNVNYNFAIDGGTAIWNGKNLGNNVVATGVYLVMISDLDSFETKVLKVLIVR